MATRLPFASTLNSGGCGGRAIAQHVGPRAGLAAFVNRLDIGREIDVFRES